MAKIYTKTGDKAYTSLLGGKRIGKGELKIEAFGSVDELNSWIGLLRDITVKKKRYYLLTEIQNKLFSIGAILASNLEAKIDLPVISELDVLRLENSIDKMNSKLPGLKHFILPGGHLHVSYVHITRTVCRRAERCVVRLHEEEEIDPILLKYLNRLSDYLFVLSRKIGNELLVEENKWSQ